MSALVNIGGCITAVHFICNDTGKTYKVVKTESTHEGNKFWEDSIYKSIDTIKRDDGKKVEMSREQVKKRFRNISPIAIEIPVKAVKKKKKSIRLLSSTYQYKTKL